MSAETNNYKLHEQAQQLSDCRSAYDLARELIEVRNGLEAEHARALGQGILIDLIAERLGVPEEPREGLDARLLEELDRWVVERKTAGEVA